MSQLLNSGINRNEESLFEGKRFLMVEIYFYSKHEDALQYLINKKFTKVMTEASEVIANAKYNGPANWIITSPEISEAINNTLNEE